MQMSSPEIFAMILAVALGTAVTRFLPFFLFPKGKEPPKAVRDLGRMLPAAAMGLLLVYCLRQTEFLVWPHGLPEMIAAGATAVVHLWKKNVLLSIAGGTLLYMFLVQVVFA